jgi:DNA-binding MurR/RpiR family transcriptional regulator
LKIAHEAGATIIAVTDYGKTPISKIADVVLYTTASQTAFKSDALSSRIAQLTILDTLFVGVAFVSYGESQENIIKTRNATVDKKIIQE